MVGDNRTSSLLRGSSKKLSTERDSYLTLWKAYLYICCCIAPSANQKRSTSPDIGLARMEYYASILSGYRCVLSIIAMHPLISSYTIISRSGDISLV